MISRRQKTWGSILSLAAIGLLLCGEVAASDVQIASDSLKSCVVSHMPDERKKQNPNVEKLLQACELELNALIELIPDGARNQIKRLVRQQSDDKLKQDGG